MLFCQEIGGGVWGWDGGEEIKEDKDNTKTRNMKATGFLSDLNNSFSCSFS